MNRICSQCHAQLSELTNAQTCPACGGELRSLPAFPAEHPGQAPVQGPTKTDRRGILLPRRHAVGGVITPR